MENTIFIVLFLVGLCVFWATMGVDVIKILFRMLVRCLLGIVIVYVINSAIEYYGGNLFVSYNEISLGILGVFGIWGVFLLYGLQYYFTILM